MPKRATQVILSEKEQEELVQLIRRHRSEQQVVLRVRIVLSAAQGYSNAHIGAAFLHDPAHQVVFYYTPKHAS